MLHFLLPFLLRFLRTLTWISFVAAIASGGFAHAKNENSATNSPPEPSWKFIENKLEREGFSKSFIRDISAAYEPRDFTQVIELNVLLFLRKSDYHGIQVSTEAERAVKKFSAANKSVLAKARKKNQVPPEVVSSLLWIESRHGRNTGDFHVPSVFLHLIQAPRVSVQNYLLSRTGKFATEPVTPAQEKRVVERTHQKSRWAIDELRAIEKVYKWKWKMGRDFRGSFSGAFGIPQFLPSSYVKWARSTKPAAQPNLSKPGDAIMSVSYYLKDHGWSDDEADAQFEALMKYNNSRDYANAILSLASRVSSEKATKREAASVPKKKIPKTKKKPRAK